MRRVFEKSLRSELYPDIVGDYELISMILESPKVSQGEDKEPIYKQVSLDLVYTNFSIYEDLFSNCLSGTLSILDANHIAADFPIIGEESLQVCWRSLDTKVAIELRFRVTGISPIERVNDNTVLYTLQLISEVAIQSEKQKISKSFPKGRLSDVVSFLCEKKLNLVDENKVEYVQRGDFYIKDKDVKNNYFLIETDSAHIEKYIAPSLSPFRVINKLCKRNISPSGSLFFFFQDINRFRFVSLEDLFKKRDRSEPIKKIVYIPKDAQPDLKNTREHSWSVVYDYKIVKRFDVFKNMHRGMYSSEVSFLDIEKRKFNTNSYYYQEDSKHSYHINNSGYLLTTGYSDILHELGNEAASTVNELVPYHTGDRESKDYSDQRTNMYQRRMSMQAQLDALVIQVEMAGDTSGKITIGDLIHFHVPRMQKLEGDLYLTGNYLVTKIHHQVSNSEKYKMTIEMISDTLNVGYKIDPDQNNANDNISIQVKPKDVTLGKDQDIVHTSILSSEIIDNYNKKTRERKMFQQIITGKNVKINV